MLFVINIISHAFLLKHFSFEIVAFKNMVLVSFIHQGSLLTGNQGPPISLPSESSTPKLFNTRVYMESHVSIKK